MLRPAGSRAMTTLRKLPTQITNSAQKAKAITGGITTVVAAQSPEHRCPDLCARLDRSYLLPPRSQALTARSPRTRPGEGALERPFPRVDGLASLRALREADGGAVASVGDREGAGGGGAVAVGAPTRRTRGDRGQEGTRRLTERVGHDGGG